MLQTESMLSEAARNAKGTPDKGGKVAKEIMSTALIKEVKSFFAEKIFANPTQVTHGHNGKTAKGSKFDGNKALPVKIYLEDNPELLARVNKCVPRGRFTDVSFCLIVTLFKLQNEYHTNADEVRDAILLH